MGNLDNLFDVAHKNASTQAYEENRKFLLAQREKGRRGEMTSVDMKLALEEKKKEVGFTSEKKANYEKRVNNTKFMLLSDLQFSLDKCDETSTNNGKSSASRCNNSTDEFVVRN